MVRELAISSYLFIFRIIFTIFNLLPAKEKTVFVTSFGDNALYVLEEIKSQTDQQIIVLKGANCKINFDDHKEVTIKSFESMNVSQFIQSIYHLATSKVVFVDNYFGFLSVTDFKPDVKCIQLWHAAGAIKQFGLKDPSIAQRSDRAKKRFKKVYSRFTSVVIGSEKMTPIFRESFGLKEENMLPTGIPRTDFFYDHSEKDKVKGVLESKYPSIKDKKVLLYAPTYRDNELESPTLALDLVQMYKAFSDEYVLLLRLHPAVKTTIDHSVENFVYDVSDYENINHLLLVTDILISDYSSIPFEFSLLHKPMIFFAYDLENYEKLRGFWEDYGNNMPGPIAKDTNDIIAFIQHNQFDLEKIKRFSDQWNHYSNGHSSANLVAKIYDLEKSKQQEKVSQTI
ncbi:CDP-glycerol glycerophosphotransferase (TagB/SpsB family) [Evansella vedderi]|uniref:CDP-glycerol glycerophosphotransferase (TagB/SpsB family) n=1 Tax=Evansella vedderi TaxID=38282 RepID=A0ABT9ZT77_9BACI|nr:CDP-glycerol glycerophosphotransferase family protein [Evansella vedderi]MDQ0254447.1 CDP-glycerol glycerophosphotransferase (TagB/SpsB family) [Evansella vedderi]